MWHCESDRFYCTYLCPFYVFVNDVQASLHDKYDRLDFTVEGKWQHKGWSVLIIHQDQYARAPVVCCVFCLFFFLVRSTTAELVWSEIYTGLPQVWFWAAPEEPVPETVLCESKSLCHYLLLFLICLWCNICYLKQRAWVFVVFFFLNCVFTNHVFQSKVEL